MLSKIAFQRGCIVTLVAKLWVLFTVFFQMCFQSVCMNGCIVTLAASVRLFSTVYFQMFTQTACLRGCIIALVTFVWFSSTVCFQIVTQTSGLQGSIIALVALIWFFSTVYSFYMLSNRALLQEGIVTEVAFVDISLICFIAVMIIIAEPLLHHCHH